MQNKEFEISLAYLMHFIAPKKDEDDTQNIFATKLQPVAFG